jgi:hypothetical protein
MLYLFYILGALKIWMLVDAIQRGAAPYWYCIIICVPFGAVVYFFMLKAPELGLGWGATRYRPVGTKQRRVDLGELRYRFEQNPSLANEALLATALYDAGEYGEAEARYRGVLHRDDQYLRARYGLSLCHIAQGSHSAAAGELRVLLDRERSYADYRAWLDLAACLRAAGDIDKSIECLTGLLAACPRMDHIVALADALIEAGRAEEARAHLERGLLDYDHSPRHVKKQFLRSARQAREVLGQLA